MLANAPGNNKKDQVTARLHLSCSSVLYGVLKQQDRFLHYKNVAINICGIVADNAANNKTMMDKLKKLCWKRFKGKPQWIRCFAHILNLVVKAILQPFGRFKKKLACNHPDPNEPDETNKEEEPKNYVTNLDEEENSTDSKDEEDLIGK
ncbi:hypothetical protein PCASD_25098 [Puccinia coronata f. sp. avenae]|uniref:DUF659 domain-containing protein n=1 Tax=Puccinia coronata f. sp. avenae TaxID=200324 RepID=A0A2N5TQU9_9BASI|nr:hypothetical protein PCASD_25098 [Puccinia coronata f. sp. avenae]